MAISAKFNTDMETRIKSVVNELSLNQSQFIREAVLEKLVEYEELLIIKQRLAKKKKGITLAELEERLSDID